MAVSFPCHEISISDLCIGKPAVSSLPLSATVSDALAALDRSPSQSLLVLSDRLSPEKKRVVAGRVCLADVLCFLCTEGKTDSSGALGRPLSILFRKGCARRVEPSYSILDALDAILDGGAEELVVPHRLRGVTRKKQSLENFSWLTQEDLVRHFLSSISFFSQIAFLSVSSLSLIQPSFTSVQPNCSAKSALSLLHRHKTPIALTTESGQLIGEISSLTVSSLDSSVLSDLENLSRYDIMAHVDCVCRPESSLVALMVQALAHRVDHVWVVDEKDDCKVVGIVTFFDVLSVFRDQLLALEEIVEL
ncbi:hypothetical protein LUZ60_016625 [Juncus effusus]|nr:hypothetical protein LUZ60_016625 [Juncus effusus]